MEQVYSLPWDIYSEDPALTQARLPAALSPQNFIQVPQVSPLPQFSGLSSENKADASQKQSTGSTSSTYLNPQEYESLSQTIRNTPEFQAQQANLAANKELFKQALAHKPELDLATPLANLSDYIQTGRLGVRPVGENESQNQNRILNWAKQIQDDQKDLYNSIREGVAGLKSGATTQQYLDLLAQSARSQASNPQINPNIGKGATKDNWGQFTRQVDSKLKKDQEAAKEFANVEAALTGDNPISQQEIRVMLTKALTGSARQNVQEIMLAQDPALWARIEKTWSQLANGTLPVRQKGEYNAFVKELKTALNKSIQAHTEQARVLGKGYGIDEARINAYLQPKFMNPHASEEKKGPDVNQMIMELLKAKK